MISIARPRRRIDVEIDAGRSRAGAADASGTVATPPHAVAAFAPDAVQPARLVWPLMTGDRRRASLMRPLAAALIVGLALGFCRRLRARRRGRGAGGRGAPRGRAAGDRRPRHRPAREFTEAAVGERRTGCRRRPAQRRTHRRRTADAAEPRSAKPGSQKPTPAAAAAVTAPGRLLVRSTPAGARVFVDGREHGQTPATIRDLARGAHRVRITRDGYVAEERRVGHHRRAARAVADGRAEADRARGGVDARRRAARRRRRSAGALTVDSRPTGAQVFLDGKLVGTTPLSLPQVAAGEHAVRLEHDGYRRWSSSIRVGGGQRQRVTASLER